MTHPELQTLRTEIDALDAQIVELLARRFRVTAEVGKLKARTALEPMDPVRESAQAERYRELAARSQINPDVVVAVFRVVIDEVIRNHSQA